VYSSPFLNTYAFISQKVAILAEKNSKIAFINVLSKVRFKETLKYNKSRDLEGIQ